MGKRMNILAYARTSFREKGFEKTSLDSISRGIGIAKGSIYSFFKNKEDILAGILADELDKVLAGNREGNELFKYLPLLLKHELIAEKIKGVDPQLLGKLVLGSW